MPYTLTMFLLWGIAFFAVGLLVGWSLRSLRARSARQTPTATTARPAPTPDHVDAEARPDCAADPE